MSNKEEDMQIELSFDEVSEMLDFVLSRISLLTLTANPGSKTFNHCKQVMASYHSGNPKSLKKDLMKFIRHYKSLKKKP